MRIAVMIEPIVEIETPELRIDKEFIQEGDHFAEIRSICLAQYQVTFATFKKVKFYLDFSIGVDLESVRYLENVAEFTLFKLKTSLRANKQIIENVTYDINRADRIIYFDIILGSNTTQTSFLELLNFYPSIIKILGEGKRGEAKLV